MKLFLIGSGLVTVFLLASRHPYVQDLLGNRSAEANYQEFCASCHGADLRSFVEGDWLYGKSYNDVFKAIKLGYDDDGMPAYDTTFTDQEIGALTSYILTTIEDVTADDLDKNASYDDIVETDEMQVRLETVVDGLGIPWGLAFLPNGDMIINEREGKISRYSSADGLQEISGGPEVKSAGQGGLLDVEIHPDFSDNQWIYFSFSKAKGGDGTTAIMRARLEGNHLVDQEEIFEALPYVSTKRHYGSRMEFDRDGYLFLSVGDRGRRDDHPQFLNNFPGKIHRIHDDGSIPEDNPFVDQVDAVKSIWSWGHRNPQGLVIHPETGRMWANEHGPRGGDEVNEIVKGENYGWPVISYGINYSGTKFTDLTHNDGMLQPKHYWVPAIGVCGMAFVTGDRYPAWKGDILNGSLAFDYIHRLKMDESEVVSEEKLFKNVGRLRDIKMGNDGYIYFTVEGPGRVIRIVPI